MDLGREPLSIFIGGQVYDMPIVDMHADDTKVSRIMGSTDVTDAATLHTVLSTQDVSLDALNVSVTVLRR